MISHYDPIVLLKLFGRNRCRVHIDILDDLGFNWTAVESESGNIDLNSLLIILENIQDKCYVVYSNAQGPKSNQCTYFHHTVGQSQRQKGMIEQLSCDVMIHVYQPRYIDGKPSTNSMAIVCFGEHQHPPPPTRRIPPEIRRELIKVIQAYGTSEATARRLAASPILPVMLNGKTTLSQEHVALTNQSVVNHLIRKERFKEFPHGTDYLGALHLTKQQNLSDPYIRKAIMTANGEFVILCQFTRQSELYFRSTEIQADKTFKRTKCREFEINGYSHETSQLTTLCRIFTNAEDVEGYALAFRLSFETAEADVGQLIPWGHLVLFSDNGFRIKAILLDEHGGQMKGLGKYFATKYSDKGDANWHIPRIVKICLTHYLRSITTLGKKGVNEGISLLDVIYW